MKQKSLMSFFGKLAEAKSNSGHKPAGAPSSTPKSQPTQKALLSKAKQVSNSTKATPSSSAVNGMQSDKDKSSVKDTPPTVIDVDMLSSEEEENERVQVPKVRAFNSYVDYAAYA